MIPMPERPDHPDFWMLSAIIIDFDTTISGASTEDEKDAMWHKIVDPLVNSESVAYMGLQRAMRILGVSTAGQMAVNIPHLVKTAAAYSEAVAVGVMLERRRKKESDPGEDHVPEDNPRSDSGTT